MPLSENELRDLLHERSATAPAAPDRVGAVRTRVARQRRRELAAVSGALAVVVAAGAMWVLPRPTATSTPPANPSPTPSDTAITGEAVVTMADVGGLSTVISGPRVVEGDTPFDLTLQVTNISGGTWTGTLAAGLVSTAEVPGLFEGGLLTRTEDGLPNSSNLGATLPDETVQFDGVVPDDQVTLDVGESRTWTLTARRNLAAPVVGPVSGWVVFADREGHDDEQRLDVGEATALTFTPAESNLPCASVQIGTWDRGEPKPWTVDLAYTAVVGPDGKATWEEIAGLGDQGTSVTSNQTGNVRDSTVMKALGDLGAAEPSAFGAQLPDRPAGLEPGRYVAYSGTQLVPITFAGTCGPSGEPISGTWTAYNDRTMGLLDCDAVAAVTLAQPAAAKASGYCPKR